MKDFSDVYPSTDTPKEAKDEQRGSAYEFHPAADLFPLMTGEDYKAFIADIAVNGQREPILLHPDGRIIDGRNRYRACCELGIEPDVRIWDGAGSLVDFVISLNVHRRHLDESQRAMVAAKLVTMRLGDNQHTGEGVSIDTASKMMGVGRASGARAQAVRRNGAPELLQAVERGKLPVSVAATLVREKPQFQYAVVRRVDEGVKPADAIREVRRTAIIENLENTKARDAKALSGRYDVIVIDPPWPMAKIERDERPNQSEFDYPVMTEEELMALPVPCADDCHVWVWTTHKFLFIAARLLEAWGLKYVCAFTWHKPGGFQPFGLPQYNSEFALYARRGSPQFIDTRAFSTCFEAPRSKHSEKPELFYDLVRRVTAGRRLDMFGRRKIEGFDSWGKEAPDV